MNILDALKGIGGSYELNRLVGAFGGVFYIVFANVFVAWNMTKGNAFDITAYCLAFPTGLAAAVGAISAAVAWKDKGVETAKIIRDTGAAPGIASTPGPQQVEVVQPEGKPVPVEEQTQ